MPTASIAEFDAIMVMKNADAQVRLFASQVDPSSTGSPTLQVLSLLKGNFGGVSQAPFRVDVLDRFGASVSPATTHARARPRGDVSGDHVVNEADLYQMASALGLPVSLQAFPAEDLNADGVVGLEDALPVVEEFGASTQELLSVGTAGRLANASSEPLVESYASTGFIVGPFPIDPCIALVAPGNDPVLMETTTALIVIGGGGSGCLECPSFADQGDCYQCQDFGNLTGGQVTVTPEQPVPGVEISFTATGVTDSGGKHICKEECGGDRDHQISGVSPDYFWQIVEREADGTFPEPNSNNWHEGNVAVYQAGQACESLKAYFRASADRDCSPEYIVFDKIANVSNFTTTIKCYADGTSRERLGVREFVEIKINENDVVGSWKAVSNHGNFNTVPVVRDGGKRVTFYAPIIAGELHIQVTAGDCVRDIFFTIVEPQGLKMHKIAGVTLHEENRPGSGFKWCIQVVPTDVSFRWIWIHEGAEINVQANGDWLYLTNWTHNKWTVRIGCGNYARFIDWSYSGSPPTQNGWAGGGWSASLPWYWRVTKNGPNSYRKFATLDIITTSDSTGFTSHSKDVLNSSSNMDDDDEGLPIYEHQCPEYSRPSADIDRCP